MYAAIFYGATLTRLRSDTDLWIGRMRMGTSGYEWDHSINNPSRIIIFYFYLPPSICLRLCNPNLPPTLHRKHTQRAIYSFHRTAHRHILQTQVNPHTCNLIICKTKEPSPHTPCPAPTAHPQQTKNASVLGPFPPPYQTDTARATPPATTQPSQPSPPR